VVPFAIRRKVEEELTSLLQENVITQVEHSEWATPVVPVIKPTGAIRLCGDFKVTLNPHLISDTYPMPSIDDLQEKMSGGTVFSKLDLSRAFSQIKICESSRKYVTITTHLGLFQYNRLPYGISTAPAIHQRAMDRILRDIPNVLCYQDDIFITGKDHQDHQHTLEIVLQRLQDHGLRLNREKCSFLQSSIIYLGHRIDKDGLHPTESKVRAIKGAPAPQNLGELRSFLGLINYYQKFLPNLASMLHPLHRLLNKGVTWEWSTACQHSFNKVKDMLSTDRVLTPYDTKLPLSLACDASAYGLGAVLSHKLQNGEERPIAFASRTLSDAEKNYAQIEREALSLIFGVTKFHIYLYGRSFTLITDHSPLTTILGPKRGIPPIAAMRMQRWAAILAAYSYNIQHKRSEHHGNADAMSRLPQTCQRVNCDQINTFHIQHFGELPVTLHQVQQETEKDITLSQVFQHTQTGWPLKVCGTLEPYYKCKTELSSNEGCVLRGTRLIIPRSLRALVLQELHQGHFGVEKMKSTARNYVWWPNIDGDIGSMAQACPDCNSVKNKPPSVTHHWAPTELPWQRIHLDFAGPLDGHMFLLAVDAYSKWPEVFPLRSTTSSTTITTLRGLFARQGLPHVVVTDNGPQFTSEEFKHFMLMNGIKHITTAPYHPQSNGQAERFVQTFKLAYKAGQGPCDQRVDRFLLKYRTTDHSTTRKTPSQLLYGRTLRTRLDLLKPVSVCNPVHEPVSKRFQAGSTVWYQDYRTTPKQWRAGVVTVPIGNSMFWVQDIKESEIHTRRHLDQLHPRSEPPYQQTTERDQGTEEHAQSPSRPLDYKRPRAEEHNQSAPLDHQRPSEVNSSTNIAHPSIVPDNPTAPEVVSENAPPLAEVRRSARTRHAPSYLDEYVR